jgi:AcrR family transcriptional regulator
LDWRDRSHAAAYAGGDVMLDHRAPDRRRHDDTMSDQTVLQPAAQNEPRVDGRRLRSERTRQLIIEAYLALAGEKSPHIPTAAEIARRAGYSVRSVFERFPDLQALRVAAVDFATLQTFSLPQSPTADLPADRESRIDIHVATRAGNCERWLPFWRTLIANPGASQDLRARIVRLREGAIIRLAFVYSPELSALPEIERRQVLIALEALTDMESWGRMREFFGLSFDEGCAVWRLAFDRMIPATPAKS